jgi:hypothetical protein
MAGDPVRHGSGTARPSQYEPLPYPPPIPLVQLGRVGRRGGSILYGLRPLGTSTKRGSGAGGSVGVVLI